MAPATGMSDPILTRMVAEDKVPWYKKPHLRIMYLYLFLCCMGVEMTSGFDSQLINTLQLTPTFLKYFGDGYISPLTGKPGIESSLLGIVNASYQLGSIFGVPIAPWFAQRYGRRMSIFTGSLIMVVGALIQGFSQHVGMYIVARLLLGVGIVFAIISGASMIGELAYPKERPVLTSLFNASYYIGAIVASAIAIETVNIQSDWAWRVPSLLQICPSVLQIATVWFLPESPRWLISRDREEEALAILTKYHAEGDASSLIVHAEMAQIKSTIQLELESSKQSWAEVLKSSGMRRRAIISVFLGLFTQMSGNTLLSYYSNLLFEMMNFTTEYAKTRINLADKCWGFMNATILALVAVRFPRRKMFMSSAAAMLCVFTAITICFERLRTAKDAGGTNWSASYAALFFFFAYNAAYNLGNNALTYTFLVELWPYTHRSRGIGVQQIFGKAGGFFSTYVNPLAMNSIGWKFFAIYCGWIFFEFVFIYFMYPETYGRTLEELTFLFEPKELADKSVAAVEKQIHGGDGVVHEESVEKRA
ncbi:hypothetical protein RB595_005011 [Gaeumannomyces hyphopodioides]